MFTFVTNIPISRRLAWAFLLAAIIPGLVISGLSLTFSNTQNARSQAVQTNIKVFKITTTAATNLQNINSLTRAAYQMQYQSNNPDMQAQAPNTLQNARSNEDQFGATLKMYQQDYQIASSPQMISIRNILTSDDPSTLLPHDQQVSLSLVQTKLWPNYKAIQDQIIHEIETKAPSSRISSLLGQAKQAFTPLDQEWNKVAQIAETVSYKVAQVGPSLTNPMVMATIVAFLITIVIVSVLGYIVNLTITRPLRQLATLTKRIAKGETGARAGIVGRDEIYMVANSMNNMLDNIVRLIQETQSQRDTLQAQVEKLVSEVSGVGEGDLRVQAEVTADALGVLADSFNYMVEELGSLVVRVKMVAHEVENSTSATLDRMTQLVETGDMQINQIAEAVVEVERMTASSHQVAERSQVLYNVARVARQDAQLGRESVLQAVEGMGRINENVQATASKVQVLGDRSREINEIVETISSMAHQTNRLALDAAIQAAMAGENGKGFGAVAADIRRLAERAKDQAGVIARIVRSVREDIGALAVSMQDTERETAGGARLTQDAGVALESIFAAVEHQAREIENINQMAVQQLQSSGAVVQIMHAVSDSTQQGSLSTRDASQNMERLARLVEQLRASVEAFKLRENQGYFVAKSKHEELQENTLSMSAILRTVSATAQTASVGASRSAPLSNDPFSYYPMSPSSSQPNQNNGWDWNMPEPSQHNNGRGNEYGGQNGHNNRNR